MHPLNRAILSGILLAGLCRCTSEPPSEAATTAETKPAQQEPEPAKPAAPKPKTAAMHEIDISQVFALREAGKALIYDVRLPLYYKLGHIEGAILFYPKPFDKAFNAEEARMKQAIKDGKVIIIYCGGADCKDSRIYGRMIAERGIPVSIYTGGWAEWEMVGVEQ